MRLSFFLMETHFYVCTIVLLDCYQKTHTLYRKMKKNKPIPIYLYDNSGINSSSSSQLLLHFVKTD